MTDNCRSLDCDQPAAARAELMYKGHRPRRGSGGEHRRWVGKFCLDHMIRVLPLKLEALRPDWSIDITKIGRW